MKTASLTYPSYHFIDTAPLAARFEVLSQAVLTFLAAGQFGLVLKSTQKVRRLVRVFTRLEAHNHLLARKLEMLSHGPWRDRVLKDLGGLRKLKLWEAARERIDARAAAPARPPQDDNPPWLYTAERIAESERLKAWARECSRACAHPNIVRDRVKVDLKGEFRLAPLPRGSRAAARVKVYTRADISDYDWNPIPFDRPEGFGPATVWPVEFHAAMAIEARILEEREASSLVIPAKAGTSSKEQHCETGPRLRGDDKVKCGNDRLDNPAYTFQKPISLEAALPYKTYRDLF